MPDKPAKTLAEMAAETAKIESGGKGICCPVCGCRHFEVLKTRQQIGEIGRRRACRHCGHRITTMEIPVS